MTMTMTTTTDTISIEDDDGFKTTWNWPSEKLGIANAVGVEMLEQAHDRLRKVSGWND